MVSVPLMELGVSHFLFLITMLRVQKRILRCFGGEKERDVVIVPEKKVRSGRKRKKKKREGVRKEPDMAEESLKNSSDRSVVSKNILRGEEKC